MIQDATDCVLVFHSFFVSFLRAALPASSSLPSSASWRCSLGACFCGLFAHKDLAERLITNQATSVQELDESLPWNPFTEGKLSTLRLRFCPFIVSIRPRRRCARRAHRPIFRTALLEIESSANRPSKANAKWSRNTHRN